jgi:TonB family protein
VVQINPTVINPRDRKPPTKPVPDPAVTAAAEAAATARANAERNRKFTVAINKIKGGLTSSLQVEMPTGPNGPGGGGPSYANYTQVVRKIYNDAWNAWPVPNDLTDDEATVQVSVTIARNGRVVSSRILRSSGSRAVINAAQAVLDRVTIVKEFPAESQDTEKTFTFTFKLNAKKSLG